MFFVETGGTEKKVVFRHKKVECDVKQDDGTTVKATHPKSTECAIIDKASGAVLGEGVAACHEKDNFEYERGRKLALTRALSETKLDGIERSLIWAEYRSR